MSVSTVRLSTVSYVVLGMIALRGPSTSYELKRAVGHSVGYFWHFPHAQLYSEPKRLEQLGLLSLHQETTGRRRKTYTLTPEGYRIVRKWLAEPTPHHFEMRDVAEIKLFFNELADPEDIAQLARDQVQQQQDRIAEYEDMQRRFGGNPSVAPRMITLQLGLEMEYAALRFWQRLADSPPDHGLPP